MSCSGSLQPLLRQAAPTLSRRFFTPLCHQRPKQCSRNTSQIANASTQIYKSRRQTPFLQAFRRQWTAASAADAIAPLSRPTVGTKAPSTFEQVRHGARIFLNPVQNIGERSAAEKGKYFPIFTRRIVAYWLFASAASVFGIVVFGGLTRLTESGLSITEWRPVTGSLPPLSAEQWDHEFTLYKRTPEFQKLNPHMTLAEFKKIYYMEWTHRIWGRVVGLSFALPTLYFIARRRVSAHVARNLMGIKGLIIAQGVVGWWMVSSGLKDELFEKDKTPRVSQYRLATHLSLAFTTYLAMLWTGLSILRERHLGLSEHPSRSLKFLQRLSSPHLRPFRIATAATASLVAITAFSGALVAGLDAGLIYNEFPYMGLGLTPPKSELFSAFYSRKDSQSDLVWRNMLENPSLVQLDHRILATSTFTAVNALAAYAYFSPVVRKGLTSGARRAVWGVTGLVWMQATLGISTLIYMVPVPVAAAHQAGALALLTGMVVLGSRTLATRRLWSVVRSRLHRVGDRKTRVVGQRAAPTHATAEGV